MFSLWNTAESVAQSNDILPNPPLAHTFEESGTFGVEPGKM